MLKVYCLLFDCIPYQRVTSGPYHPVLHGAHKRKLHHNNK